VTRKWILPLCFVLVVVASCQASPDSQGTEALEALNSPNPSEKYGFNFWNDQVQRKTDLSQQAITFCNQPEHKFLTNCQAVQAAAAPRIPFSAAMPSNGLGGGLFPVPTPQAQNH